ncbi:DinB family protein [Alteribacter populi]|uniref:DinB family protein n=1 Tax=Alteribacter populi TaxID=2011011 RepID=UPI000BBAE952|nr:DinB family protein [Alteribacter populi]
MNTVISKFEQLTSFFNHLNQIDDETFYQPIAEGKWSTAAIVAHFYYWDQFIVTERLPYMLKGEAMPSCKNSVESLNREAEQFSKTLSKNTLIDKAIISRLKLAERFHASELSTSFTVANTHYTLLEYVEALCKHDEKHVKEVASFLYSSYIGESIHSLQMNS